MAEKRRSSVKKDIGFWKKEKARYVTKGPVIPQKDETHQELKNLEEGLVGRNYGESLELCIGYTVVRSLMFLRALDENNIASREMSVLANSFSKADQERLQEAVKNPAPYILNKIFQVILLRSMNQRGQEVFYTDEEAMVASTTAYFNPEDFKRLRKEVDDILQKADILEPVRSPGGTTFKKVPNKIKKISNSRKILKKKGK